MSEVESKVFPVRQAPPPPPPSSPFIDQHNHDDIPTTTAAVTSPYSSSPCFSATGSIQFRRLLSCDGGAGNAVPGDGEEVVYTVRKGTTY
ncbi:hypothetical protein Pmani_034121 [Petrolisthes manimaculis]|uniref:Uncharacterized protein n=1 Tax=Petrolisthes manimaculis TaxID=1843537 RepID=A0AAE1TPR9_9EUCA|nr:hypothetical protein Pmani_034121 [Petrolisthes manimaculis]